jgi:hypothetical protein
LAAWLSLIGVVVLAAGLLFGLVSVGSSGQGFFTRITLEHFPAVVGLPASALAALSLVLFLENRSGPIEFEAVGFKFKGASGPAVLWAMCFLVIVFAIKLLWSLD